MGKGVSVNAVCGNEAIEFVRGDTYTYAVEFGDGELVQFLTRLVFTCKQYGIEKEFEKVEQGDGGVVYQVRFEDTGAMCPGVATYDVTAYFSDGGEETVVSETGVRFRVLEKKNPVGAGDGM